MNFVTNFFPFVENPARNQLHPSPWSLGSVYGQICNAHREFVDDDVAGIHLEILDVVARSLAS